MPTGISYNGYLPLLTATLDPLSTGRSRSVSVNEPTPDTFETAKWKVLSFVSDLWIVILLLLLGSDLIHTIH